MVSSTSTASRRSSSRGGLLCTTATPPPQRTRCNEALALWRGPALADLLYEPFAQLEAARLEERRLLALEERIAAELGIGRAAELVGELEALVREHPFRERLLGQLMVALYRRRPAVRGPRRVPGW